ncbi:MAG: tyrosine-protein kinase family protein [Pirellula sp.]
MSRDNPSFPNSLFSESARRAARSVTEVQRRVDPGKTYRTSAQRDPQPTSSSNSPSNPTANPPAAAKEPQESRPEFTPARPISLGSLNRLRVDPAAIERRSDSELARFQSITAVVAPNTFEVATQPWTILTTDTVVEEPQYAQPSHAESRSEHRVHESHHAPQTIQPKHERDTYDVDEAFAADVAFEAGDDFAAGDDYETGIEDETGDEPAIYETPAAKNARESFSPAWEVDAFLWPEVVLRLEQSDPAAFHKIGLHLAQSNAAGLRVLAVTSGERGVGRSTVAMHMARAASAAGLRIALVDADVLHPSLFDQLHLDIDHGWQQCVLDRLPMEEAAVIAIDDRLTLFPIHERLSVEQMPTLLARGSRFIEQLTQHFDLIILDSCRVHAEQPNLIGVTDNGGLDAAVIVVDSELSVQDKVDQAISILQAAGLTSIGIVENFRA